MLYVCYVARRPKKESHTHRDALTYTIRARVFVVDVVVAVT